MSAKIKVASRPSKRTRHGFTLSADQLMKEAARREMGARIRELRERSPYKQQHMADKLSVGLRMYQRIEQWGTTEWERVQQIAEIHGSDPHWIWDGEENGSTPDVIERLDGSSGQLARMEGKLDQLLDLIEQRLAVRDADDAAQASHRSDRRSTDKRASNGSQEKAE
jgi:transcriptional regulator with XRE-family HTH domain